MTDAEASPRWLSGPGLPAWPGAAVWAGLAVWLAVAVRSQAEAVLSSYRALGLLDLQIYRMGGRAVLDGDALYQVAFPHDGLLFTYPPFAAAVFVPLTVLGWAGGALAMTVVSVAALARVVVVVVRSPAGAGTRSGRVLLAAACVAASLWPVRSTLEYGQINLVLLWLVVEDVLGAGRGRRGSGVGVGLATGIKLTPGVFIVFLAATRQWRRAAVAGAAALATVAVGAVVAPGPSGAFWGGTVTDASRVGSTVYLANQSWRGVVDRALGPSSGAGALWLALSAATALGGLALCRRLWAAGCEGQALLAAALVALLVSPISWTHHWVWLVTLPALLLAPARAAAGAGHAVARAALIALFAAATIPRLLSVLPSGGGAELSYSPVQQVVASSYVLLAVAVLVYLAVAAAASPARPAAAPSGERPLSTTTAG